MPIRHYSALTMVDEEHVEQRQRLPRHYSALTMVGEEHVEQRQRLRGLGL